MSGRDERKRGKTDEMGKKWAFHSGEVDAGLGRLLLNGSITASMTKNKHRLEVQQRPLAAHFAGEIR